MYQPWLANTKIGSLHVVGGLRRPTGAIIGAFTIQWIPGYFGYCVQGSHAKHAQINPYKNETHENTENTGAGLSYSGRNGQGT
jgi:hypothetical protein